MARYWKEPELNLDGQQRTGILLMNLGTPAAPTASALRPYLKQFLSDPRVVEIPRAIWWLILNGVILNIRPRKSAEKYASIWTPQGSPLKRYTEKQAALLQAELTAAGYEHVHVEWAMRYGDPSIQEAFTRLKARHCQRIIALPMYPQYAASTTASTMDALAECLLHTRNIPDLQFIRSFPDHPAYIQALASSVREQWQLTGQPDKLVMSFHGVPKFSLDKGDPYYHECRLTGLRLAEALDLREDQYLVTFQSRFGKAEWLQPYTQPTLEMLARQGVKNVDVICPGFTSDCLETLEEIAMECKHAFIAEGGQSFNYIPCLNERPDWIAALLDLLKPHLAR